MGWFSGFVWDRSSSSQGRVRRQEAARVSAVDLCESPSRDGQHLSLCNFKGDEGVQWALGRLERHVQ
eukprot:6177352-Pleurochrysis_carterae.AAC.1